jgi:hypothetical protein
MPVEVLGLDTERKTSAGNRFNAVETSRVAFELRSVGVRNGSVRRASGSLARLLGISGS